MALIVAWWHCLGASIKTYCGLLAAGESISGFNAFTKRNVRDLEMVPTPVAPRLLPLNAVRLPMTALAAVPGSGSKEIDITWTDSTPVALEEVDFYAAEIVDEDGNMSNVLQMLGMAAAADETVTFAMDEGAQEYAIFAVSRNVGETEYSTAAYDSATSHAA
jgi:hypothetical protein